MKTGRMTLIVFIGLLLYFAPVQSEIRHSPKCGDINADDLCNSTDALIILSYDVGFTIPAGYLEKIEAGCGDINKDGSTNSTDALIILSYDVGFFVPYCVCDCVCPCPGANTCETVTDYDGNVYQTVQIGDQCWMAENLKVTHYRNGDVLPYVTDSAEWVGLETGAYCNYDNDENNVADYGSLYNWHTVVDVRNIAPPGWHVPTDAEWWTLVNYLGGEEVAGGKMKTTGTIGEGTGLWCTPNTGATNESGFAAVPGGCRYNNGEYNQMCKDAIFWSATANNSQSAWRRSLHYYNTQVVSSFFSMQAGLSVRCVKDAENTPPTASFNVDPTLGTIDTVFNVDASGSSDLQDLTSALQVRWDWEDDGTYDTGWSTTKTNSHQYSSQGTYTIKLEVMDTDGLTDTTTQQVTVDFVRCGTITDYDGNVYQTVQIGDQCWMAENLKVTHFRNGDPVDNVTDFTEWANASTEAYCNYSNNPDNVATYGRLYNWYAVSDNRGLAPAGWHVASDMEWKQVEMFLGMSQSDADAEGDRGTDEGGKIKEAGSSHWFSLNVGATNESGFSALPGGYRFFDGAFEGLGGYAEFWSSTEGNTYGAWFRGLGYDDAQIYRSDGYRQNGFSMRCVKDSD